MFGAYALPAEYFIALLEQPQALALWKYSQEPSVRTMDFREEDMLAAKIGYHLLSKELPVQTQKDSIVEHTFLHKKGIKCEYLGLYVIGELEIYQKITKLSPQEFAQNFASYCALWGVNKSNLLSVCSTASFDACEKHTGIKKFDGVWSHPNSRLGFVLMSFVSPTLPSASLERRFPRGACAFLDARELARLPEGLDLLRASAQKIEQEGNVLSRSVSVLEQSALEEQIEQRYSKKKMGHL